jgi:hypothetical protein
MTPLIPLLIAALPSALVTPRAVASLRAAFPEIPPEFLERRLVL